MKYRCLTQQELQEVEAGFIKFLSVQGIPGPDWVKIKENDPERVNSLIEQFSDLVFEDVLSKVEYLEHRLPHSLRIYYLDKQGIKLQGLLAEGETPHIDFTKNESPEVMMSQLKSSGSQLKLFNAQRPYRNSRQLDAFELLESGARISHDGELFQLLRQLSSQMPTAK